MASAYTPQQTQQFLDYIGLSKRLRDEPPTLSLLKALHIHTLAALPYENLSLHYNPARQIDLDPQFLFQKIVVNRRGRGGFCMENAILYNHILRSLGYNVYTAGVRTRPRLEGVPRGDFPGWGHIVNIVTFPDGQIYHDDIAFGGDGATMPMPLVDGLVHQNLGAQEIRLIRDWIPTQTHRTEASKLWIYQYRNGPDKEWNSFYSFTEIEFMPADWGVVNHWFCTHPTSHQRFNVLVVKFLRKSKNGQGGDDDEQEIYGKRMLVNGVIKENLGGRTQIVAKCTTEDERIMALKKYFDISLTDEERLGIRGWKSELNGS